MKNLPLFPEQASTFASQLDLLYFYLIAITVVASTIIFGLVFVFAIKYRRKSETEVPAPNHGNAILEALWILIPLGIVMTCFLWGAKLYFDMFQPPRDAMEVYVVGKQWMWKLQHPHGKREINELHVPVGTPVKLIMTSEDVIHSFYVPAFRIKMDVLPGRYTSAWFEATKPGSYHLFCAEYCGTKHSGMIGRVIAMTPADYAAWLGGASGAGSGETMAQQGAKVFGKLRCDTCHSPTAVLRAPALDGILDSKVTLSTGKTVTVDEAYVRESILKPQAKLVAGYDPIMPTYEGQVSETEILQLIAYIKSLGETKTGANP